MYYVNPYGGAPTQYGALDFSQPMTQAEPSIWQLLGMSKGVKSPGMAQANRLGMSAMGNYQDMGNYSNPVSLMNMLRGAGGGQAPYQEFANYTNPYIQQLTGGMT